MEEIIKSKLLEFDKSTFLFDLVKHKTGATYINIKQNIENNNSNFEIKINPSVLSDFIYVLQDLKKDLPKVLNEKEYFSEDKQSEIIKIYFKGVTIEELTIQFDCSKQIIEQILFNKGIEIVDNSLKNIKKRRNY